MRTGDSLVKHGRWIKFGRGLPSRVHEHLRAGCTIVQALRAPFEHVVAAEKKLKQHAREKRLVAVPNQFPDSWGTGPRSCAPRHKSTCGSSCPVTTSWTS